MPQQHRRRQRRPVQQPWASGTSAVVLLALLLGQCQGFVCSSSSSKAYHTRLAANPTAHNRNHRRDVPAPVLQRSRRRRRDPASPTMAGDQRDGGGYGRFGDAAGDEPAYRPAAAAGGGAPRSGRDWEEIGNADVLVP
ncbi:unnamed protein product, partial [Ectocarpus fasciculatus]